MPVPPSQTQAPKWPEVSTRRRRREGRFLLCANEDVFAGSRRVVMALPGLNVEYSWLPPFRGASLTRPNRLEVVFSAHDYVAMEQERVVHEVRANPGGCFVVGAEPPTL